TDYAAVARSGRVALVAFPLGQGYYNQGFWPYRQAFQKALGEVLPAPLLQTDAHLSTELSITHQAAKPDAGAKGALHGAPRELLAGAANAEAHGLPRRPHPADRCDGPRQFAPEGLHGPSPLCRQRLAGAACAGRRRGVPGPARGYP